MKEGSDNFRESAVIEIAKHLSRAGIEIFIYEPTLKENKYHQFVVLTDLKKFKSICEVILANRIDAKLDDVKTKIFSRDIFSIN